LRCDGLEQPLECRDVDHLGDRISVLDAAFGLEFPLLPDRHLIDHADIVVPKDANELPRLVLRREHLLVQHVLECRPRIIEEEIFEKEGNERVALWLDGWDLWRCRIGEWRRVRQMEIQPLQHPY